MRNPIPTGEDRKTAPLQPAKKVLIYRLGSLGDTVVALPSLHLIARTYPDAERTLLTNVPVNATAPPAAAVLGDSTLVHRYIHYPPSTRNIITLAKLAFNLRKYRPDVLIYLAAPRGEAALERDIRFFRFCGIHTIYGLPIGDRAENLFDPTTGLFEAEAHRLARTLQPLGDAEIELASSWDLQLTREELSFGEEIAAAFAGNPYIVCAPGCKAQANDWEDANWSAFFAQLSSQFPNLGLLLTGAPSDFERNERFAGAWAGKTHSSARISSAISAKISARLVGQVSARISASGNVLNISGATTPRQAAAVLVHAAMYIGPDSGPMHIAAAVGTPCISIFSARNKPGVWFPYARKNGPQHHPLYHQTDCSPCGLEHCIEEKKRCILSIQPSEPLSIAMRILEPVFRSQGVPQLS